MQFIKHIQDNLPSEVALRLHPLFKQAAKLSSNNNEEAFLVGILIKRARQENRTLPKAPLNSFNWAVVQGLILVLGLKLMTTAIPASLHAVRRLIVVFVVLFLSSCDLDQSLGKKAVADDNFEREALDALLGEWNIYATINGGVEANCNACPKIIFNSDKTAKLLIPSGDKETLHWTVNNNRLTLLSENNSNVERIFPDSFYRVNLTKYTNFTELELKQPQKGYSKILRR
ncbi:MAG: lipocalin family protein [Flavisolibacter sp.]